MPFALAPAVVAGIIYYTLVVIANILRLVRG